MQCLLLLWFVVEDHDTLFILSESVHFMGIGLLAYKLIKKRAAGGGQDGQRRRLLPAQALFATLPRASSMCQRAIKWGVATFCTRRPVAEDAGADGGVPAGAPVLLLHDGV